MVKIAFALQCPYHPTMSNSKSDILATLGWLTDSGADEAIGEVPTDRFSAAVNAPDTPRPAPGRSLPRAEPARSPGLPVPSATPRMPPRPASQPTETRSQNVDPGDAIGSAMTLAGSCNSLEELRAALEAFEGCTLKKSATTTVFADGTPSFGIMLIGEAPGREEDLVGRPFVGRAGKLLDKMLAAIKLDRKTNVYITNVLNWRPPGNRDPSPEESASCLPFLRRHIELVSPGIIVLLGAVAARHVLGRTDGIMRLRGKWLEYYVGGRMIPVMPTLHPAYLLRRSIDKKLAWRDLQDVSMKVNSLRLLEEPSGQG
jgi:DNA polymerase